MPSPRTLPAALLVAFACGPAPAPTTAREAIVSQFGGDPATIETRRVPTDNGAPIQVTSFTAKTPDPQHMAEAQARCDADDFPACITLGNLRQNRGDDPAAERAWRRACDANIAQACHDLGNMLSNPAIAPTRGPESVPHSSRACESDHIAACYFLAGIHDRGEHGVPPDPIKARALYERGCKNGHHWACKKVEVGDIPTGGACEFTACAAGLWCIQNVCTPPPA